MIFRGPGSLRFHPLFALFDLFPVFFEVHRPSLRGVRLSSLCPMSGLVCNTKLFLDLLISGNRRDFFWTF